MIDALDEPPQLCGRVAMVEPGIVVIRELPTGTPETLVALTNEALELVPALDDWALVLDLSDWQGALPESYRQFVPAHFQRVAPTFMAMVLSENPVVRASIRFLAQRIGRNVGIPDSRDAAMAVMRAALERGPF
jgi:hypothetical protein